MKQKGLAPILIVLLIGVVIGGYFVYTNYSNNRIRTTPPPTTQPTLSPTASPVPTGADETVYTEGTRSANWKTYTNTDTGVSFKFPSDWVGEPIQILGSRSVVEFKYKKTPLFELTIIGNYNQLSGKPYTSLDEYIGSRLNKARDILVNTYPAKMITDPGDAGHVIPYEEVLLFNPDKSAIISLYYKDSYYDSPNKNSQIFNQILSTFKFLP